MKTWKQRLMLSPTGGIRSIRNDYTANNSKHLSAIQFTDNGNIHSHVMTSNNTVQFNASLTLMLTGNIVL